MRIVKIVKIHDIWKVSLALRKPDVDKIIYCQILNAKLHMGEVQGCTARLLCLQTKLMISLYATSHLRKDLKKLRTR